MSASVGRIGRARRLRIPKTVSEAEEEIRHLVEKCRVNDKRAWCVLDNRFRPVIRAVLLKKGADEDQAEEIAQRVMLGVYRNLASFRYDCAFTTWLHHLINTNYIDVVVRAKSRAPLSFEAVMEGNDSTAYQGPEDRDPTPEKRCFIKERSVVLRREVRFLPATQRHIVGMRADGMSYEEIVSVTGLTMGTVKSRLHRANHSLRERLVEYQDLMFL